MVNKELVRSVSPTIPRAPMWPLLAAPIVAAVYYVALRNAFAFSLPGVVSNASDVDLNDIASPQWGSHWIYRIFAEASSLAFGTFVAAGIARERGRLAAVIGGLAISLFYLLRNAGWIYVLFLTAESGNNLVLHGIEGGVKSTEPWYQHALEAAIVVGTPFLGAATSHVSLALNSKRSGFGGINRLHFLWLWAPAALYANEMIARIVRLWLSQLISWESGNRILGFLHTVGYGLPVLAYAIPILWGLTTLAHENEAGRSRLVNNIVGSTIIVFGFLVANFITFFWEKFVASVTG